MSTRKGSERGGRGIENIGDKEERENGCRGQIFKNKDEGEGRRRRIKDRKEKTRRGPGKPKRGGKEKRSEAKKRESG